MRTAAVPLVGVAWIWVQSSTRDQGARLFHGQTPLTGRLVGHADPLPSEAVQCKNCHSLESDPTPATPPRSSFLS
ncbi:MAG TPA: hypothetical protein VI197_21440 [Polyangiaceae bacterium]